ncbi:alcohol dehydrogenase catalytic domain-containing protein [Clostridium perfringens]|uniref:alcohol dehydrogenase catalytic domain-containing protein n=1 Tax=Clostridium perfringens TaxID=1502 RepID=UPI00016BC6D9|nr:alcohol dehydrogenase catalytic domain-containing protein [Clostridium perfringens]EDT78808.1 ribitol-5-phosphate 2-dehydrogenase [Clostridium perfringens NCTC 8239]ELC8383135.1 alcohol dehydrogenase catalytic domain-containing protein [Clostridium perfringens]MCX0358852.1 alcohol dehydrogenase catalytic domain-containing protein [Clostridium perfringens]MCX0419101.1 alcohol dehydrogenase catalytic domain-containing protein [Clostridium perfringens]MDK0589000.1 alcohol dehydrogenase catalyt
MLSKGFKVVSPRTFELDIENVDLSGKDVLVRIDYGAICKADIRYYLGERNEKILGLKYPMRLIHEAVGTVLKDKSGKYLAGQSVVLVPNICMCEKCNFEKVKEIGENYCPKAKFASSNIDGFSSEIISYQSKNLVEFNEDLIDKKTAVFSELISVAIAATRRLESLDNKNIAIWGDGILGYILCSVIRFLSSNSNITIVGKNKVKIDKFEFADNKYLLNDSNLNNKKFDILFECVGGNAAEYAINEMLNYANYNSNIVLTGVSENGSKVDTRKILEKGLVLTGSTRSNIEDFIKAIKLLEKEEFRCYIEKLIISENEVSSIVDYYKIFDIESKNKELGKNLIRFKL